MNFNIRGENLEVTSSLRDYVEKKVGKLEKYFDTAPSSDVHVKMSVLNKEQKVEITIPMPRLLLRAEEKHTDMYAAIDLVIEKLERQIRKHKTKVNKKFRTDDSLKYMFKNELEPLAEEEIPADDEDVQIVRTKRFDLKPMDAEEAVLQMDMLGHNFFVFADAASGSTSVVYKRRDGKYGLIEPEA
ncbi:ribosome hibernation-promoting factor, HPF/YfiA family [Salisediminibacterium halotolerans]|uniref:Ribosome hibernation promoting factor n=1 Tax=Salisediminibacterium halotolerans TaxID=517425 RepID=A0A1H9VLR1_9BACI|nr:MULTISPECIES: ribosome-associated translation inhibitor RaiA [Salisediminibacterium]RLJ75483.1 SSU ribosomal protein S30P /sigma 54 modulation protein [Actinophytocola xinjiangensis]RPE89336.1 SSU ribosomal protein S30P /sigma 54 modulation protein [Salisediminibacterium halotolerans]TWG36096.1 SSU ribosomal protein S30P /sigma 54 modulation protein [Salisediminibacterium halotolerans]SES22297.1 putative sigma-54 modulation protein [Salisediminibacterium haloalkalitolerans]GEL08020.1 riboso